MIVVGGPAANGVDEELANLLNAKLIKVEHKIFPDGESYIRYPTTNLRDDIILVQSLYPPQDKHFVELLLMLKTAKEFGAKKVITVVPYLAYARQDKRFLEGEAISINVILEAIEHFGTDAFITVDIHNPDSLKKLSIPYVNTSAVKPLTEYVRDKFIHDISNTIVLSPDKGGIKRARKAAQILGVSYDYIEKVRDRVTGEVKALPKELSVQGKTVFIIDDIISTGGTIALATHSVLERGAKEVYVACTHALLVKNALERMYKAGVKEVVSTVSVPSPISKVRIGNIIVEALRELRVVK